MCTHSYLSGPWGTKDVTEQFKETMGQIQNLRFCDGRNLDDIFSCPEFPVVRLDPGVGHYEWVFRMNG